MWVSKSAPLSRRAATHRAGSREATEWRGRAALGGGASGCRWRTSTAPRGLHSAARCAAPGSRAAAFTLSAPFTTGAHNHCITDARKTAKSSEKRYNTRPAPRRRPRAPVPGRFRRRAEAAGPLPSRAAAHHSSAANASRPPRPSRCAPVRSRQAAQSAAAYAVTRPVAWPGRRRRSMPRRPPCPSPKRVSAHAASLRRHCHRLARRRLRRCQAQPDVQAQTAALEALIRPVLRHRPAWRRRHGRAGAAATQPSAAVQPPAVAAQAQPAASVQHISRSPFSPRIPLSSQPAPSKPPPLKQPSSPPLYPW